MNKLRDRKPSTFIEVPVNLLQYENGEWLDWAFVYALDSTTIGIAGQEMLESNEIACFTEKISLKKTDEKVILQIPDKFNRFYNLERQHKAVSVNGNNILIIITGKLIEEKKYPS